MPDLDRQVLKWALSEEWLGNRMCFISGPRQVGKTTAIQRFLAAEKQPRLYYNWDTLSVKRRFAQNPLFFIEDLPPDITKPWMALDEIHKYPKWKNLLKGYYDEWRDKVRFIVSGSARLDLFRRSGDSLVGRYFLFRMLPLGIREVLGRSCSLAADWFPGEEISSVPPSRPETAHAVEQLLKLSGYPEPFLTGREDFYTRWQEEHLSLILREDLRDLTKITHLGKLETLLYLLPERTGSPLSLNSLCQPLGAAHGSIRLWLEALKRVYLVFSVGPWTTQLARSVRREEKYYFWDWGMVEEPGARFENFMAVQLQRAIASWNERGKGPLKLFLVRTKDGKEADFGIAHGKKVLLLVEAKAQETSLSQNLAYFQSRLQAPLAIQVVNRKDLCQQKGKGLYVMSADRFLALLP